jgi:hypothetical protein
MTVFNPDNTVANIKADLATIAKNDIGGLDANLVYANQPDGPPESGGVTFELDKIDLIEDTNAKLIMKFSFLVVYHVRRTVSGEDRVACESYAMPFFLAYNSWANQALSVTAGYLSDAYDVTCEKGQIAQRAYANNFFMVLATRVSVLYEFNTPLT